MQNRHRRLSPRLSEGLSHTLHETMHEETRRQHKACPRSNQQESQDPQPPGSLDGRLALEDGRADSGTGGNAGG